MTSQLQRRFSNNITTLYRRLFTMLLQRRDMVERCRDLKTTTLQRRHDVLCLPGWNRWTGGVSMKDYEKREKNKGNENKTILEDFNCTMDIMDRDGEKKQKDFIGVTPVMPCQNSSWIMGLRIYREGRTQIPLS